MTLPFNTSLATSICAAMLSVGSAGLAVSAILTDQPLWVPLVMALFAGLYAGAAMSAYRRSQTSRPIDPYLTSPDVTVDWEEVR